MQKQPSSLIDVNRLQSWFCSHLARLFPDYISPSHFSRIDAVDVLAKGLYEAWKTYGNPE